MADLNNKEATPAPQGQQQATPQPAVKIDIAGQASQMAGKATQFAGQASQVAGNVQGSVDQAKKAADQVSGQLKGGVEQLKKVDVTKMFQAAAGQPAVTQYEKLLGGVSYIPLAPIGTLVIKGDSNFIRLHGRQSLVLTAIFFLCLFLYLLPFIGVWLAGVIQFATLILGAFSMYQALVGNWWKIPILGDIAEMIPIGFFVQIAKEAVTGQPQEAAVTEEKPAAETPPPAPAQEPPAAPTPPSTPPATG
jgi:uncharacterized membrane protein/uncharacterized protein YjbJ (UPF0337 family)